MGDVYWKAYQNDGVQPNRDQYGNGDVPVIPEYIDIDKTMPAGNTNWADEVYQRALLQNYNISVTTSNDNISSMFSFNFFDQNGLIKYTNFQRFNIRLNNTYSFLKNKVRLGENLMLATGPKSSNQMELKRNIAQHH